MRYRKNTGRPALLSVIAVVTFPLIAMAAPPIVTVSANSLTIAGLAPGSSVALIGVAREAGTWLTHVVVRREVLNDDDRDGRIEYVPKGGTVAFRSIWMVTDFETGETTVAAPPAYNALAMDQTAGPGRAVNVLGNILDIGRPGVQILLVRPRRGAWMMAVRGGQGTEPSVSPGRARVDVAKLRPLRRDFGAAPAALVPGDVLLFVDEQQMEYSVVNITPGGK